MIPRRRYDLPPDMGGIILEALRSGTVIAGPHTRSFEERVSGHLSTRGPTVPATRTFSSGRAALLALLESCGVPQGSKVMVPAYTLGALVPFLRRAGFGVTACDVGPDRPVVTPESVERAWEPGVSCVLLTHLFGHVADTGAVVEAVKRRGGLVIEDCAHAMGCRWDGVPVGTAAAGALFSFDHLKPVNTFGGGLAVTGDTETGRRLQTLEEAPPPTVPTVMGRIAGGLLEDSVFAGPWLRLPTALLSLDATRPLLDGLDGLTRRSAGDPSSGWSDLQARIGLAQLTRLDDRLARRRGVARRVLGALDLTDPELDESGPTRSNAYFVVVQAAPGEDAGALRRALWTAGVDAGTGTEVADDAGTLLGQDHPVARKWFHRAIQLPCFTRMMRGDLDRLCRILTSFRGRLVAGGAP